MQEEVMAVSMSYDVELLFPHLHIQVFLPPIRKGVAIAAHVSFCIMVNRVARPSKSKPHTFMQLWRG